VVRFGDLIVRGAILDAFRPSVEALMFWIESACFLVPIAILRRPEARSRASMLFVAAVLVLAGGFLLRIDGYLVGYETGAGWHYFPSVPEILVTLGMIAAEILGYIIFVRMLPILPAASSTR
jgi:Ni/Fe-hydrogenase subunit HybB-like protein